MGFVIEISQVGQAEFPLLQTLRQTVFEPFGHRSLQPIADALAEKQDLLALLAHLEGNPVGFAVGYRRTPRLFYLNYLGILPDYRGQGLGQQLLRRQEEFAQAAGYDRIEFNTFNHFPQMIRLGLKSGYLPIGIEQHAGTSNDLAIRFGKWLSKRTGPTAAAMAQSTDEIRIRADNTKSLLRAIETGGWITGLVRSETDGQLDVIVAMPSPG